MNAKLLVFLAAIILSTGCKTAPDGTKQPDIARIALITREAAAIGTAEAVARNPEWRDQFQSVVVELRKLETANDITPDVLLFTIRGLPVNELRSRDATLAITSARLLVVAAGWSDVTIVRSEQMRPVVAALRDGIELGLK